MTGMALNGQGLGAGRILGGVGFCACGSRRRATCFGAAVHPRHFVISSCTSRGCLFEFLDTGAEPLASSGSFWRQRESTPPRGSEMISSHRACLQTLCSYLAGQTYASKRGSKAENPRATFTSGAFSKPAGGGNSHATVVEELLKLGGFTRVCPHWACPVRADISTPEVIAPTEAAKT